MIDREFFTEKHLARRWGIEPRTLQKWRWKNVGPPYMKLSTRVLYSIEKVKKFEEENTHYPANQKSLRDQPKQSGTGGES